MASNRIGRINEEIQRELAALLRTVKDPRVHGLVSITHVDTTPDLRPKSRPCLHEEGFWAGDPPKHSKIHNNNSGNRRTDCPLKRREKHENQRRNSANGRE